MRITAEAVAAMQLAQLEFERIHALCDRANVPRTVDGELLSAAQRVTTLEEAFQVILAKYIGGPVPSSH